MVHRKKTSEIEQITASSQVVFAVQQKLEALVTPGIGYHQHFNPSPEPMRYVVLRFGNPRYQGSANARFRETGGTNMEFGDEPAAIRELFESEVTARNATSEMAQYAG